MDMSVAQWAMVGWLHHYYKFVLTFFILFFVKAQIETDNAVNEDINLVPKTSNKLNISGAGELSRWFFDETL
jgi:hypothetical protein